MMWHASKFWYYSDPSVRMVVYPRAAHHKQCWEGGAQLRHLGQTPKQTIHLFPAQVAMKSQHVAPFSLTKRKLKGRRVRRVGNSAHLRMEKCIKFQNLTIKMKVFFGGRCLRFRFFLITLTTSAISLRKSEDQLLWRSTGGAGPQLHHTSVLCIWTP